MNKPNYKFWCGVLRESKDEILAALKSGADKLQGNKLE
jgi:hypothetical protein